MKKIVPLVIISILLLQIGFSPLSLFAQDEGKKKPESWLTVDEKREVDNIKNMLGKMKAELMYRIFLLQSMSMKDNKWWELYSENTQELREMDEVLGRWKSYEIGGKPETKYLKHLDLFNNMQFQSERESTSSNAGFKILNPSGNTLPENQRLILLVTYLAAEEKTCQDTLSEIVKAENKLSSRIAQIANSREKEEKEKQNEDEKKASSNNAENSSQGAMDSWMDSLMVDCMNKAIEDVFRGGKK